MAIVRQKALTSTTWWVGVALMGVAALAWWVSRDYGRAGIMPGLTSIAIFVLAGVHTVVGLVAGVVANDEEWHDPAARAEHARRRTLYALAALAAGVGVWLVGFHVTLPVFLLVFVGLGTGRWLVGAALGAGIWVFTWVVLANTLHIVFPATVLRKWMIANGWF